jgi:WXG100 family type VII secretion target
VTDTASPAASPTAAFALVPEHVSDAGRYVQQTAQNLISGVRSASAEVDGLMSSWRGAAATAYAAAWDETHAAALDVFESLAGMADLLGVVVDRTAATDTTNAGEYGSLTLPPI